MNTETIKVKRDGGKGYRLINKSDFDPKKHKAFDGEKVEATMSAEERKLANEMEMRRKVEANRGQVGTVVDPDVIHRNPSGTYSEPTPTDIRYPDKTATEFENNLGAFVGKSAAGLREEMGLPDAPGGIHPHRRVAKGPKGLWFVMEGEDRVSQGFKSEADALAEIETKGPAPEAA